MNNPLTVALIGNPNTGKSTLFNALSGSRALTGNYPGVTVEKKIGRGDFCGTPIDLVDLPGTYSLAPRSLDEMVSVRVLLGIEGSVAKPDGVICVVDASNLERNLYLVSQILDLQLPTVVVLNMCDVAKEREITIDIRQLASRLGIPIVESEAHHGIGIDVVKRAVVDLLAAASAVGQGSNVSSQELSAIAAAPLSKISPRTSPLPAPLLNESQALAEQLGKWGLPNYPRYLCERMLLDVGGWLESHAEVSEPEQLKNWLLAARERLAAKNCRVPAIEARSRYAWIKQVLAGLLTRPTIRPVTLSDKIDRVLTHHLSGLAFFVLLMLLIFQAIYKIAEPAKEWCEAGQGWLSETVVRLIPPGPLASLAVDGVIAGVGSVLVFLPQIAILFFFIALLEDCGYMARAAFLMDRLMTQVGLSGKSFVPLMSSFACAIPGVMATRVIENRRDRMATILIAPLMSCSARLPVYTLMIGAFFPATYYAGKWIGLQELMLFVMTAFGAIVAIPIAWLFKKTLFRGETPPFVMELPSYKLPAIRLVWNRVYDQSRAFVLRAGTLIFMTNVLIWALGYFPGDHSLVDRQIGTVGELETRVETLNSKLTEQQKKQELALKVLGSGPTGQANLESQPELANAASRIEELQEQISSVESELEPLRSELYQGQSDLLERSYLGQLGHSIEPLVKPLGWDWRIGVGVVASFPAREVIVSTLGTIYRLGGKEEGLSDALQSASWPDGRPVYSIPVALSIMVFFALCAQCGSTLMVIRRETGEWKWAVFTFCYMTTLAYFAAWIVYQVGSRWF